MKIQFKLSCHTEWGQQIYIVGSNPALGSWDTNKARLMNYFPGDEWKTEIDFPADKKIEFEYKYIIKHDNGPLLWEGGNNRNFSKIPDSLKELQFVEFRDTWRKPSDPDYIFLTSAFSDVIFSQGKLTDNNKNAHKAILRLQVVTTRVDPEHTLCVAGSLPILGNKNIANAIPMNRSLFPLWTLDLHLKNRDIAFSYNYIIKDKNNKLIVSEDGLERIFENDGAPWVNTHGSNCYAPDVTSGRHPERALIIGFTPGVFSRRDKLNIFLVANPTLFYYTKL